eukprot:303262_1
MEAVLLGIYCAIGWKLGWTKAPRDEKFCVMVSTVYEVDEDSVDGEFENEEMDEERQEQGSISPRPDGISAESPDTWLESSWRSGWLVFRRRKRKFREEEVPGTVISLPTRATVAHSITEGLESQIDAITDLVPFPDKGYSRCRINSEESTAGTAITAPISEPASDNGSPTSMDTSTVDSAS